VTRFISLAGKRRLALTGVIVACLAVPLDAGAGTGPVITGDQLNKLVVDRLEREGLKAAPKISATRAFLDCQGKLEVKPLFGGWKTVQVICPDPGGWKLAVRTNIEAPKFQPKKRPKAKAVPIRAAKAGADAAVGTNLGAKKTEMMTVMALGRSLSRGEVIMPQDIIALAVPKHGYSGVFHKPEDLVGRKLKTRLSARKPVQARHLQTKWLVEAEDEVTIQNRAGGISVDMVGMALENGQFGEWIKVRNLSSGIIITGQIKSEKIISTNPKILATRVVN